MLSYGSIGMAGNILEKALDVGDVCDDDDIGVWYWWGINQVYCSKQVGL